MCGGFTCLKRSLTALNLLFATVAITMIGVAAYGIVASYLTNIKIMSAIIGCGVSLFFLSLIGLIGAARHNQVLLFFYACILFLLFIVQFAIACACLAFNESQQHKLAYEGWRKAPMSLRNNTQMYFNCCEFEDKLLLANDTMKGPSCQEVSCCRENPDNCSEVCLTCWSKLKNVIGNSLKICGGIGLFFSFTEFLGIWLTVRYRNQKMPRANPSAFL